ncbi:AlpA family transcriptional regulator [Lutibacter oceani]|uniref:AlpA family transcriptional regulator n=1 Tax=Lutibacter oceani TaxID=1853311 RepID=A0A3D9RQD7_9FLAO|nr:helix-turn-helix domain-containing protein [Lutibacter oceani]REE82139.1 AlpA family transcriptional regulator [Lutibacter oceani]
MLKLTIDSLPEAVQELNAKMDIITMLLQSAKPTEKKNDLLNIQEAATFLNLSKATLYNKVSKRELPVMKQGKRLYFSREELTSYIKSGKVLSDREIEDQANNYLSNYKKIA